LPRALGEAQAVKIGGMKVGGGLRLRRQVIVSARPPVALGTRVRLSSLSSRVSAPSMSSLNALNIVLAAFISMSAVELLKDLTPLRYVFNRWAVQRWLWRGLDLRLQYGSQLWAILRGEWLTQESISPLPANSSPPSPEAKERYKGLEQRVVELAACGQRAALYRPEVAQIAGQLHLLAERLMDFPSQDPIVLRAIAGVPEVRPKDSRSEPDDDLKRLAKLTDGFRAALAKAEVSTRPHLTKNESAPSESVEPGVLIDTRTRVTGWVQGRLNELQTTGRTAWRTVLLVLAIGIGVVVFVVSGRGTYMDGVFAGVLAPIAYELLSMTKRVGRP
jgi:hypothetical protein